MPTVLITGTNRGIGLEFVRQYAGDGWRVIATARDPARAPLLAAVEGEVTVLPLEATDKKSVDRLAAEIKSLPIDLLIANAGVVGPRGMQPELIDRESWIETLSVNALAPLALAGALKPNLEKGQLKRAVALSSRLASNASNTSGGMYVYRSSKAALNAVWRSLAMDWKAAGIVCAVLHPGWVKTEMGGAGADISPEQSVTGLRRVIAGLTPQSAGGFFNWDGAEIPW